MPWKTAEIRGVKVWVRVDDSGAPIEQKGLAEVYYKQNGGKPYRAALKNIHKIGSEVLKEDSVETGIASSDEPAKSDEPKSIHKPKDFDEEIAGLVRSFRSRPPAPQTSTPNDQTPTEDTEKPTSSRPVKKPKERKVAVIAYTDGACTGNPGPAGAGFFLHYLATDKKAEGYEYLGQATNNIAELTAILRALEALDEDVVADVYTDSQYSIGVLQKGWQAKANQSLIADIKAKLKVHKYVRLHYVKGHAGIAGNEQADALARKAVSSRSSKHLPAPAEKPS